MAFVRIYTGSDGESHFEDLDLPFEPADLTRPGSFKPEAKETSFRRTPAGFSQTYHNPTEKQYVVTLAGMVEIEVGSGEVRRFGPADVSLMEDVTGRGHIGRVIGNEPLVDVAITVAE